MKRSAQVSAPLLASAALALLTSTGCRTAEPKRCVDENNRVVDPTFCAGQPQGASGAGGASGHSAPGFIPYHYYYGGLGGYALGSIVSGGSTAPIAGHSYSTGSTSRGGFGSSFGGGHGSGGEGGGGHGGGGGE